MTAPAGSEPRESGHGGGRSVVRVVGLTCLAMTAFAANSILTRLALAGGEIDAAGFSGVRLLAGAAALALLAYGPMLRRPLAPVAIGGSWRAAACLLGYVLAFSFAYLRLGSGVGALVLFGSVQIGMLGWAMVKGERHGAGEWLGLALALAGFAYLTAPNLLSSSSLVAPDPVGAGLMVAAGLCWAAYSLIGRGSGAALLDTAGNFLRCAPVALLLAGVGLATRHSSLFGLACAMVSGALASGLGYAIWYAALPLLSRARAAIVQLTVPPLAALGGVALIGEPLTMRLVVASVVILGGVGLTIRAAERRRRI